MKKSIFDYMQEGTSVKPTREKIRKSKKLASASVNLRSDLRKLLDAEIKWCEENEPQNSFLESFHRAVFKKGFIMGLKQAKTLLGNLR